MQKILLLVILSVFLFLSCQNSSQSDNATVFLGGKIVNPTSDFILIFKDNQIYDTVNLKADNTFGELIEDVEGGLYTFKHGNQSQLIYLEPDDSLLLRLNTYAFDESLSFTGIGERRNNYLIDMFLENEESYDFVISLNEKTPREFDSIAKLKRDEYSARVDKLLKKANYSDDFEYLAKQSVNYEYYDLKERYYYLITKFNPELKKELDPSFFDYRNEVNFNDPALKNYYGYLRYLDNYIKNKTVDRCILNGGTDCADLTLQNNLLIRIALTDSLYENWDIRDYYVQSIATSSIATAANIDDVNNTLSLVENLDIVNSRFERLKVIAEQQKEYLNNGSLNTRKIKAVDKTIATLGEIIKQPTILITWSSSKPQQILDFKTRYQELKTKLPGVKFMFVNIDKLSTNQWLKASRNYGLEDKTSFQLVTFKEDQKTLIELTRRVLILNSNCKVVNRSVNFLQPSFETTLKKYYQ